MELIVDNNFNGRKTAIFIRCENNDIIGRINGELAVQHYNPNGIYEDNMDPFLEMNTDMAEKFFKAVGDFNSRRGIVNENENLLKGKLQATEKHLEDLRKNFDLVLMKIIN